MKSIKIQLSPGANITKFVNIASKCKCDVDVKSGRFVVNAKSILGIFSLDLSKPLIVDIYSDNCQDILDELECFAVK